MANNKKFRVKNGLISPDAEIAGALTANTVIVGNTDVQTLINTAADQAYANATAEASGTFNTLGTMSTQDAANVNIGGGLIDNTSIDRGSINRTEIGLVTPNQAAFTNVSANSVSSNNLSVASITYPTTDGINGQVIATDGSGSLSFTDLPPSSDSSARTLALWSLA